MIISHLKESCLKAGYTPIAGCAADNVASRRTLERCGFMTKHCGHYKIFCVNGKYGIQVEFRIFYFIALQNEEDYERKESSSA